MTRYLLASDDGMTLLGEEGPGRPLVAILADAGIVLHRVRLSGSGRARLLEAEALGETLAAGPAADLHIAIGPEEPDGACWLAIADRDALEARIARIEEAGHAPDSVVPAALFLPPAAGAVPSAASLGDMTLLRAADWAGAVEPGLARELGLPEPPLPFQPGEPAPPFDLRQGRLARRAPFWRQRWFQVPAALMVLAGIVLAAVPPVAAAFRARLEREALETATLEIAGRALGQPQSDPEGALSAVRAAAGPPPLAPRLAALLQALEPVPGAALLSLAFRDGALEARLEGSAAAINQVARTLAATSFPMRQEGDLLRMEGPRRPDPGARARARFDEVREAAPVAARRRAAAGVPPASRLARHLASVGLVEVKPEPAEEGARATIPAIRAHLLLPLLARLEADGLWITAVSASRNPDPSLAVQLEVR